MTSSNKSSRKRSTASAKAAAREGNTFIPARQPGGATATLAKPSAVAAKSISTPVKPVTASKSAAQPVGKKSAPVAAAPPTTAQTVWNFLRGPYPTIVSRVVLGVVFLLAGVTKAMAIPEFKVEMAAYKLMPDLLVAPMATLMPLLEILVAVFLLLGLQTKWAAVGAGVLLVVFEIAVISAILRGLQIDCGCFAKVDVAVLKAAGNLRETVSWRKVAEDGLYLLMCAHLFFIPTIFSLDQRLNPSTVGKRK